MIKSSSWINFVFIFYIVTLKYFDTEFLRDVGSESNNMLVV